MIQYLYEYSCNYKQLIRESIFWDSPWKIDPNWQDYSIFLMIISPQKPFFPYPGFTFPLVAIANVTACLTYHIKLFIADVATEH
ncbi:MAG: hypothetical protein CM15mP107_4450 [Bacteroidota bacterium]|nr:MAG: hypothetical protein CM15mP107_4450 [Bacteroidota bacterium]